MKILVTSNVPDEILNRLKENFELDYHDSNVPLSKEEIIERVRDVVGLVCPLSDKIDKDVIDAGKNLKIIANYGAGFDNIDFNYAKEKNIIVTNAPAPSSAVSTAELTFGLILASARKFFSGERNLREGNFLGWRPTYFLGSELRGKTLGIIGMGNIGQNLAKRALAFEMDVIYNSRNRKEKIEELGAVYKSKEEVIKEADFLTIHTAFAPDLKHMIGTEEFKMMKPTAYFINAARGPLMDEGALIDALKNGEIAGAGLDVYEFEPKVSEGLMDLDNVILIPHLGNATHEARMEMGKAVADNLEDYINGDTPRNKVN
ncbi:MAG: NAD(P)-binding domain-containing protein [Tissierellia bacterium]|nr:NAD(P)-binding domain-containing protein [Tissierellia bacterium]